VIYDHDVVIDRGAVSRRKKKPSKPFRDAFGHTLKGAFIQIMPLT
jgi:hypothetical protein